MSGLPRALAPWAPQLSAFAPDLAVSLGGWARRIAAALGPPAGGRGGAGEPDGLAGLARRGPYERLVATEWLLADELPHEFLRRAATGEHLFLHPGVRSAAAVRRSIALLDAGPDQLGTPRLAQLALLVVLAARAEATGVAFAWGIAQDPAGGLVEGFGEAQVRRFLAARSARSPDAMALRVWDEALPPARDVDDRWLVGGPALVALAGAAGARVVIEDGADPEAREVRLEVHRAGARREAALPLPSRADCTRLFRDPFRSAVAAPAPVPAGEPGQPPGRIIPEAGILWSPNGQRVAVRLAGGFVLDAHVSSSPRQPPGRAKRHRGDALLGFGWGRKRRVLLATRGDDAVFLSQDRQLLRRLTSAADVVIPPAAAPHEPLAAVLGGLPARSHVWLHHPSGMLYTTKLSGDPILRLAATGVSAAIATDHYAMAYVTASGPTVELVAREVAGGARATTLGRGTGRAFLSAPGGYALVVAHEGVDGSWTASALHPSGGGFSRFHEHSLCPPSGATVVGVTLPEMGRPALLLLEDERRDFRLLDVGGSRPVHGAGAEVVSAAVSPANRVFAYTTRAGALVVYSLDREAVVLEVVPGEKPWKGPMP